MIRNDVIILKILSILLLGLGGRGAVHLEGVAVAHLHVGHPAKDQAGGGVDKVDRVEHNGLYFLGLLGMRNRNAAMASRNAIGT